MLYNIVLTRGIQSIVYMLSYIMFCQRVTHLFVGRTEKKRIYDLYEYTRQNIVSKCGGIYFTLKFWRTSCSSLLYE